MKKICLTQNKCTLVDDEDYEYLSKLKWCYCNGYAVRTARNPGRAYLMHRVIMNAPKGFQVDHIDGDKLNNIKSNLRICTKSQNLKNRVVIGKNNTSGYKGVGHFRDKWLARIMCNGKAIHLGFFDKKEDAANAYDIAAKRYHGKFARTNS